jgi:hypothetical protein
MQVDSFLDDNRLLRRRPIGGHTHRNASHTSCTEVDNKKNIFRPFKVYTELFKAKYTFLSIEDK